MMHSMDGTPSREEAETTGNDKIVVSCLSKSWGGLEMVALELVAELERHRYNVTALCYEDTPLAAELHRAGLSTRTLAARGSRFGKIWRLRQIFRELRPKHVILNRLPSLKLTVPALFGIDGVRVTGISHMLVNYPKKNLYHRWLYRHFDRVVVLTKQQLANHLAHLPIPETKFAVVPDWINEAAGPAPRVNPRAEFAAELAHLPMCLTASRLDPQKGIDLALRALGLAKAKGNPFLLAVVGENTLGERDTRRELERLARELGITEYVRFFGYQRDIRGFIAASQAVLVPSHEETFGRVIIEGFALGVPVIASRAGGAPCLIDDGRTGLLFETKNEHDLEKCISRLFNDEAERKAIARAGAEQARIYAKSAIFPRLVVALGLPLPKSARSEDADTLAPKLRLYTFGHTGR